GLHAFRGKAHDPARQHAEARHIALLAALKQHLQADAQAQEGLGPCRLQDGLPKSACFHLPHAIRHGALAGEDDVGSLANLPRVAADRNLPARRHLFQRLGHGAQVAHAIVDDDDVCHENAAGQRLPLVDGRRPPDLGSVSAAMRRARPKALKMVSAWWWALRPLRLSMCSVTWAWFTKPWKN